MTGSWFYQTHNICFFWVLVWMYIWLKLTVWHIDGGYYSFGLRHFCRLVNLYTCLMGRIALVIKGVCCAFWATGILVVYTGLSLYGPFFAWAFLYIGLSLHGPLFTWAFLYMGLFLHGPFFTLAFLSSSWPSLWLNTERSADAKLDVADEPFVNIYTLLKRLL